MLSMYPEGCETITDTISAVTDPGVLLKHEKCIVYILFYSSLLSLYIGFIGSLPGFIMPLTAVIVYRFIAGTCIH